MRYTNNTVTYSICMSLYNSDSVWFNIHLHSAWRRPRMGRTDPAEWIRTFLIYFMTVYISAIKMISISPSCFANLRSHLSYLGNVFLVRILHQFCTSLSFLVVWGLGLSYHTANSSLNLPVFVLASCGLDAWLQILAVELPPTMLVRRSLHWGDVNSLNYHY